MEALIAAASIVVLGWVVKGLTDYFKEECTKEPARVVVIYADQGQYEGSAVKGAVDPYLYDMQAEKRCNRS